MPLYTFFAEYKGGTYISQVVAQTPAKALKRWAEKFDSASVPGVGPKAMQELTKAVALAHLVPIAGINSTWCFSTLLRGHAILAHFTKTGEG